MASDVDISVISSNSRGVSEFPIADCRHTASVDGSAPSYRSLLWLGIAAGFLLFNMGVLDRLRFGDASLLGLENGYLENMQLMGLALAAALFGHAGFRGLGAVRAAGAILALCMVVAFLREIDLERMTVFPTGLHWVGSHACQYGLYGLLAVISAFHALRQRRYGWNVLRLGLRWQAWPSALAVVLLVVAEFLLDGSLSRNGQFWEELVEANGYFLFAVGAWVHAGLIGHPDFDRPF